MVWSVWVCGGSTAVRDETGGVLKHSAVGTGVTGRAGNICEQGREGSRVVHYTPCDSNKRHKTFPLNRHTTVYITLPNVAAVRWLSVFVIISNTAINILTHS